MPKLSPGVSRTGDFDSGEVRRASADGALPLSELAGNMDAIRSSIQSGEALVRVVIQPWGIEFFLVPSAIQVAGQIGLEK